MVSTFDQKVRGPCNGINADNNRIINTGSKEIVLRFKKIKQTQEVYEVIKRTGCINDESKKTKTKEKNKFI